MGAYWQSDAGANLTFSVFLNNVNLSVQRQFLLTKIVSLSLVDLLAKFGVPAKIKWPNDVYVNDRKIAGVLIENVIQGKTITRSIIGIGLNVNQRSFEGLKATSLSLENNRHYSIERLTSASMGWKQSRWKRSIMNCCIGSTRNTSFVIRMLLSRVQFKELRKTECCLLSKTENCENLV